MSRRPAERRILVQETSTMYYEAGAGPPVLLLHGNVTSARDWWQTMEALAATNRVLALALPGYGDTSPLGEIRPARLVSFASAFLDELGLGRVIVVGHSLGGQLAAEFALAYPDRVERLVLADSAGLGRVVNPLVIANAMIPKPIAELLITMLLLPGGGTLRTLTSGLQLRQPWRVSLRLFREQVRLTRRRSFLHTSYEVVRVGTGLTGQRRPYNLTPRLTEIQAPTLVIWGLTDQIFPLWQGMLAARKLPRGQLAIIFGAGHLTYLDSYEEFIDVLGPFVRDGTVARTANA
ncbi:alpha/beta fold hydrolase [Spirillospora sp. NPDC048911]|uniref:alpha/beta fold hydrolase n=1 Tax=Spirillospora sp. NPDC048911 TaxID=3364527 RepID=UPI0037203266